MKDIKIYNKVYTNVLCTSALYTIERKMCIMYDTLG